jgi:uncharacterized phage protein gp47/JayE
MSFGLTATGFKRKMFEDSMKDVSEKLASSWGSFNTDEQGTNMQLLSAYTFETSSLWEALEALYNSMYPDTAFGMSLDNIVSYIGVVRIQATKTTTLAKLSGKNQIEIPFNSQVTAENVDTIFNLNNTVKLSNEACYDITLTIADNIPDNFTIFVNINNEVFNYVKQAGASLTTIVNNLVTLINASNQMIEASNVNDKLYIKTTDNDLLMEVYISQYISIDIVSNLGTFSAEDAGYITLAINALTNIQTPISGWISVINETSPNLGRNLETDEELRIRRRASVSLIGAGTVEAIRAKVANLPGVSSVVLIENATDQTVNLLPPHSFECLVAGGNDNEIASTIWQTKGAAISTYGNVTIEVPDSTGNLQTISFSRPVYLYIYVDITLVKDESKFPINGNDIIKNNVVAQISKFAVGETILYQSLFAAIYNVPGVTLATVLIGGNAIEVKPSLMLDANITMDKSQIQKTDISKITIS